MVSVKSDIVYDVACMKKISSAYHYTLWIRQMTFAKHSIVCPVAHATLRGRLTSRRESLSQPLVEVNRPVFGLELLFQALRVGRRSLREVGDGRRKA